MLRLLAFLALFCCNAAQAQDHWFGRYEFVTSGMNATGTRSWVAQDLLDIRPDGDRIVAVYNAAMNGDGFDYLAQRWIGRLHAHKIVFTFDSCLPRTTLAPGDAYRNGPSDPSGGASSDDECSNQQLPGTPMLTLAETRGKNGKRVLLTYFHAFESRLDKRPAGGIRYFQKAAKD